MKKLISLVLILCMACLLVPAMADEDVTGEWYLKTMKNGDTEYDAASIGYNIVMTLNADGTVVMITPVSEDPSNGTWTLEGDTITVNIDDSPVSGTVADGVLSLSQDETTMIFTREQSEGIQLAEVNPDAAAEDFEGEWTIKYVSMAGLTMDPTATGEAMPGLLIENGSLKFTGESSMTTAFGTSALPLTYENGALGYALTLGETSITIKAEMLQDGMLALSLGMGDTVVGMYFVK